VAVNVAITAFLKPAANLSLACQPFAFPSTSRIATPIESAIRQYTELT
jgi:hypothetical protein